MTASSPSSPSIPNHVAIIMDGNGRWAQAKRKPRIYGHQAGVETVRRIVEAASQLGIQCLTLYSFSTENWTRPKAEISALFSLMKKYVNEDLATLNKNRVRIRILGARDKLPRDLKMIVKKVERETEDNQDFFLNIAFNYGGRDEILRAMQRIYMAGLNFETVTEDTITAYLDTGGLPDPDLIIRTSGEHRISNFLLWQAAYSEFVFVDTLWPDFTKADLEAAIAIYSQRDRRFGSLDEVGVA